MRIKVKNLYQPGPWEEVFLPSGANLIYLTKILFNCSPLTLQKEQGPLAVLINGQNMLTLNGWETELFDNDSVLYTPMMFGG